jgi:peroxiredoxin
MSKRNNRRKRRTKKQPWWNAPLFWLGIGTALIVAGVVVLSGSLTGSAAAANTSSGDLAPDFELMALDQSSLSLSDYRGQYVLVNFWATWCPPCRAELPDLVAFYEDHADEGFMLIGVNERESAATVQGFLASQNLDFPVALDVNGTLMNPYAVSGLPSSFLIDPEGRIVQSWPGMINRATLEGTITPLLGG